MYGIRRSLRHTHWRSHPASLGQHTTDKCNHRCHAHSWSIMILVHHNRWQQHNYEGDMHVGHHKRCWLEYAGMPKICNQPLPAASASEHRALQSERLITGYPGCTGGSGPERNRPNASAGTALIAGKREHGGGDVWPGANGCCIRAAVVGNPMNVTCGWQAAGRQDLSPVTGHLSCLRT